jgi:hypothetical protein
VTSTHASESAGESAGRPRRLHRLLAAIGARPHKSVNEEQLTSAILGTVVGSSAMVAASAHGTLGTVVVSVLVTVAVYWAADCYARLLAARGTGRRAALRTVLRGGWPIVEAAYTPLAVLLLVSLVTKDLRIGVLIALGLATLVLGGLGYFAARRVGDSRSVALKWSLLSASLGVVVIVLKLLLH